jgi:transcriptional regulator with XRE-family HTH domain
LDDRLRRLLANLIESRVYSIAQFAALACVQPRTVTKFLHGGTSSKLSTLDAVLRALNITVQDLARWELGSLCESLARRAAVERCAATRPEND